MPTGVYIDDGAGGLLEMLESPVTEERKLQELLARHPSLLSGGRVGEDNSRRWLLLAREVHVPESPDGRGRLQVDHVFLDDEAVLTLVEVKRSANTQIRREVVGQMLDYAANAVLHWDADVLRSELDRARDGRGDAEVQAFASTSPDNFWKRVKENLAARRVRLIFVADEVPIELKRIVELLSEQMDTIEVLAVELRHFEGGGRRCLVPRTIGGLTQTRRAKSSAPRATRQWDERTFFERLRVQRGEDAERPALQLLEWASAYASRVWWGQGIRDGSFVPILEHGGEDHQLIAVYSYGSVEVYFQWLRTHAAFESEERRLELLQRVNEATGIGWKKDAIERRPSIQLQQLAAPQRMAAFIRVLDWMVESIERS